MKPETWSSPRQRPGNSRTACGPGGPVRRRTQDTAPRRGIHGAAPARQPAGPPGRADAPPGVGSVRPPDGAGMLRNGSGRSTRGAAPVAVLPRHGRVVLPAAGTSAAVRAVPLGAAPAQPRRFVLRERLPPVCVDTVPIRRRRLCTTAPTPLCRKAPARGARAAVRAVPLGAAPDTQPRRNVPLAGPRVARFPLPLRSRLRLRLRSRLRLPRRFQLRRFLQLRRFRRIRLRLRFRLRRGFRFRMLAAPLRSDAGGAAGQHRGRGGSLPPSELTPDAGLGPGLGVRVRAFVAAARVAHAIKTHDDLDRIASRHVWQRACPPLASRPHWIQIAAPRRFSRSFAARSRCAAAQSSHSLRPGRGGHLPHRVQEPSAPRAA